MFFVDDDFTVFDKLPKIKVRTEEKVDEEAYSGSFFDMLPKRIKSIDKQPSIIPFSEAFPFRAMVNIIDFT